MARAHVMRPITGETGDLLYGAQVTVREAGQSVKVAQPLYAGPTGNDQLTNPFVTANGVIDFWMDEPQRVSVLVEKDGFSDILVYLDGPPPPEETARTDSPLLIVGKQVPGNVLLAGDTPGQAVWGPVPANSGVTPRVTVINEDFDLARDPAGWSFTQAATSTRDYPAEAPTDWGLTRSLHARHTGNAADLVVLTPGFTLAEAGFVSLWVRPTLATGESVIIAATTQGGTKTVLETITQTRPWGFYRYPLAAGTYQSVSVEFKGAATFVAGTGHEAWMTGLQVMYGGTVPAHTHAGSGTGSVALGANSNASGLNSIAVGTWAQAWYTNATAFGNGSNATAIDTVAVGPSAKAVSQNAVAVGARATGSLASTGWTAVGADAYVDSTDGTAIGRQAKAYGSAGTAIGTTAYVGPGATNAVAIGKNAQALAPAALALGANTVVAATHNGSSAIGDASKTSAAQQTTFGNPDYPFNAVVVVNKLYALTTVNIGTDATSRLGFFGAEGTVKPTVTGSDGGNLALRNLISALAGLGLLTNNTTA
ncbi:hypothetical protein FNV58_00645 (plasmid) [Streptomyces sp. RLB1-9]|uniref:hypothetical protein n=1 Tax=Streptomyces sp. RLB1-9 TaxID=2594454 RepID=UPI0011624773|nr:hypothetical protein [Streptomyces sp. RLB1-9]QDN94868.1 hypothetical protein FNV58_00645 [Streptomyces sp. RLB1-9]